MADLLPQTLGSDPLGSPAQADSTAFDMDQFSTVSVSESGTEPEDASPIRTDHGPADQIPTGSYAPIFRPSYSGSQSDSTPDGDGLGNCLRCRCENFERCSRCSLTNERKDRFWRPWGPFRRLEPSANPYSWKPFLAPPKVEVEPTGVGAGLSNLGNTCFLNAVLQCFTHTVPFVEGLRSVNEKACKCGGEDFCILCALKDHIELALNSSGEFISPSKIFDNLNHISSDFQRYQQEDAHEFLVCLLDKLESCLDENLKVTGQAPVEENLIKKIFGGRLVSKLSCCNCGHCSETHEPVNHLSLEIEDVDTLSTALESFTRVELINSEAKFKCENCKEEVSVEKQLLLDQAPPVMAFQLKRFKNDGYCVEKIGRHVEFPLELDLQPYAASNQKEDVELKYQLYAVVEHYGFRLSSGHYISYVRSSPDTWHMLNDSRVTRAEEKTVLSEAAYILFYSRQDIPWFSSAIKVQKPCLNDDASNTSPKSVLDNVDRESASRVETTDDCMNDGSENDADGEAMITSEAKNDDEVNETITAYGEAMITSEAKNGDEVNETITADEEAMITGEAKNDGEVNETISADGSSAWHDHVSRQNVSELSHSYVKAPVLDSSVLPGSNVCSGDQNEGKRFARDAEIVGKSSSSLEPPDRSHVPDVARERSSGPSQEDSFIHSKNLKARRSAHSMSGNSCSIDRGRMEAIRFCNKMPSSRGSRLIQSVLGSQSPLKQKRKGSSPSKVVGPCKRKRMASSSKRGSPGKRKRSSPCKWATSPHKRKRNGRY